MCAIGSTSPRASNCSPASNLHHNTSHMHNKRQNSATARRRSPRNQPTADPSTPTTHDQPQDDSHPIPPRSSHSWIVQYHDVWSRLTLSSFYQKLQDGSLLPQQFGRWLLDRASVAIAILEAATRAADILRLSTPYRELPLLRIAKEDAQFLAEFTVLNGLDINSRYRLSHAGKRLVDLIEASTAPDAAPAVAITAVWGYMLASWQGWDLCQRRGQPLSAHFDNVARFMGRKDCISQLGDTQQLLDRLLNTMSSQQEYENAGKTFEEIASRSCAVLDHTVYIGEGNQVPLCTCGRKGHYPSQCCFKSHI